MARHKHASHLPVKPILYGLLSLIAAATLLVLSQVVVPADQAQTAGAGATTLPAATAPAGPADSTPDAPSDDRSPSDKRSDAAATNLSGLLLLFSMAGFLLCLICIGWLVIEIRKNRPAWKRQTKFPKMR